MFPAIRTYTKYNFKISNWNKIKIISILASKKMNCKQNIKEIKKQIEDYAN